MIISLDSPRITSSGPKSVTIETDPPEDWYEEKEWLNREAYLFVLARCGAWRPADPRGWPDEVKDEGCRCTSRHGYKEKFIWNDDHSKILYRTNIWVCSDCEKPKQLMTYVEWCESCGIPYVVKRLPDRTLLCEGCGG